MSDKKIKTEIEIEEDDICPVCGGKAELTATDIGENKAVKNYTCNSCNCMYSIDEEFDGTYFYETGATRDMADGKYN